MFRNLRTLVGASVLASDGGEKPVRDFLFDDQSWSIRFLIVDVGSWLTRHLVVIPTVAVDAPDWTKKAVAAHLTREQLLNSPDADSQKPVSRQQQLALNEHFGWPDHTTDWLMSSTLVPAQREFAIRGEDDPHLRRAQDLIGYEVCADDGHLGLLEDFVLEQSSWHINYIIVRVGDWVCSREQFISTTWTKSISWANHRVTLDRDLVEREEPSLS